MALTTRQKRFIDFYLELGNATEAARRAGYNGKNLSKIGSDNLNKPEVKAELEVRLKELDDKRVAKAQEVLEYLTRVLRGEEVEQVVVTENTGDYKSTTKIVEKEVAQKDRIRAAELLGKRYRLFVERIESEENVNFVTFVGEGDLE